MHTLMSVLLVCLHGSSTQAHLVSALMLWLCSAESQQLLVMYRAFGYA